MKTYLVLLRGINVGLKNRLSMAELRICLEELGFANVKTYIASGNVLLQADKEPDELRDAIEAALPIAFPDSEQVRVLVLTREQLQAVVDNKPAGFGEQPDTYYCDAIFLMGID